MYGECELLPHWSNKYSTIKISRYFNITNTQARYHLITAMEYYTNGVFFDGHLDYKSECITYAILDALQSVSYEKYVINCHNGCILIKSRSNAMKKININAISFTVDNNEISVDFKDNIITINNTDYTKEDIKNILKCLKEIGYDLQ